MKRKNRLQQHWRHIISRLGLTVASRYELVPNLVVLDVKGRGGLAPAAVVDPAVQSQQLLDRIAALRDSGLFEYVEPPGVTGTRNKLGMGSFAIQAHDPKSEAHFKNIRVKPLAD